MKPACEHRAKTRSTILVCAAAFSLSGGNLFAEPVQTQQVELAKPSVKQLEFTIKRTE